MLSPNDHPIDQNYHLHKRWAEVQTDSLVPPARVAGHTCRRRFAQPERTRWPGWGNTRTHGDALRSTLAAATLLLATAAPLAAQVDPVALDRASVEALNRGDVAAAVALFTDDVVLQAGARCGQTPCVGKDAVRQEMEREVAQHLHLTHSVIQVSGLTVLAGDEIREDDTQVPGPDPIERLVVKTTIEVRGDKIASIRSMPDPSDNQTARFFAVAGTPRARDGQSLFSQTFATRASFATVWRERAAEQWAGEHDTLVARLGR